MPVNPTHSHTLLALMALVSPSFKAQTTKSAALPLVLPSATAKTIHVAATEFRIGQDSKFSVPGPTYTFWLQQPDHYRIDQKPYQTTRKEGNTVTTSFFGTQTLVVSDGKTRLEVNRLLKYYSSIPAAKARKEMDQFVYFDEVLQEKIVLSKRPGMRLIGHVTVDGKPSDQYEAAGKLEGTDVKYQVYLDPKTGLPWRIDMYFKDKKGPWLPSIRTEYADWELNKPIAPDRFDTTPPTGFTERKEQRGKP